MKLQNLIHMLFGIVCIGLLPGTDAVASDTSFLGQNRVPGASPFAVGAATHEMRADSQTALRFPNASEISAGIETVSSATPTRSSFMARWDNVPGATGYLLDVSTSSLFSDYVDGYHDLNVGNVKGRVVTGLNPGTTYYYRVRPYTPSGAASYSGAMTTTTVATTGLNIHATFDGSITGNPNAAAIQAMINQAISIYESLFSDPITIEILFRYATTAPDGTPLPQGNVALSYFPVYTAIPWNTAVDLLRADAKTSNDNLAIASLPGIALSANIVASSANGRAVGGNTPPAMFANGAFGTGGPYDGIVTLNSAVPFQFTRPTSAGKYDAQSAVEHEIDEVMGLGSRLTYSGYDLRPQDVFSWSSPGVRNITSSGTRYFSINSGNTNIVNFNQDPSGDFGDWFSEGCPQAHPYVQNAFGCPGQSSDVTATSPEGINLDVIGYDLVSAAKVAKAARAAVTDFNGDRHPDYVLQNASTHQKAIWYLNNNVSVGGAYSPTLPANWGLQGVADFNRDSHPDYALFNSSTRQTAIWYLSGPTRIASAYGPTVPSGWELVATADFNGDGKPDYVLFNSSTRQTALWYLNNNVYIGGAFGPTLPAGWSLIGIADFNRDGHRDYALFNPTTGQTAIWYLSGRTLLGGAYGPSVPNGWQLVATADFNGDNKPDYVLFKASTRQTALWYLNNNALAGGALGPSLPVGWSLVAP